MTSLGRSAGPAGPACCESGSWRSRERGADITGSQITGSRRSRRGHHRIPDKGSLRSPNRTGVTAATGKGPHPLGQPSRPRSSPDLPSPTQQQGQLALAGISPSSQGSALCRHWAAAGVCQSSPCSERILQSAAASTRSRGLLPMSPPPQLVAVWGASPCALKRVLLLRASSQWQRRIAPVGRQTAAP